MKLRIGLVQFNAKVGDFNGNGTKILGWLTQAKKQEVDVVVFPELAICGYPPEDLLLKDDFVARSREMLGHIARETRGLTAIVGAPWMDTTLYNAAVVMHDGEIQSVFYKQHLPNYGVFDEDRYFTPGQKDVVFTRGNATLGVSVCEDIWVPWGPAARQSSAGGAQILINISASPYHRQKGKNREQMLATRASDHSAFVAYCNLVGGQDELVFDGQSLIIDPNGNILARARAFEEELLVCDLDVSEVNKSRLKEKRWLNELPQQTIPEKVELRSAFTPKAKTVAIKPSIAHALDPVEEVYQALVMATRDYVRKNGFEKVVIGLSGGIDSALTAAIAVDALGSQNVVGVGMPTRYSSDHSVSDARKLADNLGMTFHLAPIEPVFQAFMQTLSPITKNHKTGLMEENLQPRVRGTLLMALSNAFGWLVLTTGNKSETAVGYSTLYGDTAGGYAVIKDVPKMLVYELSRYRNRTAGREIIPQNTIDKAPSAELRPDQKDSDSLPEYPVLDPIVQLYVQERLSPREIIARGYSSADVRRVLKLIDRNEYKRRQSPPGVKITPRAFGRDWRIPLTNGYSSDGLEEN